MEKKFCLSIILILLPGYLAPASEPLLIVNSKSIIRQMPGLKEKMFLTVMKEGESNALPFFKEEVAEPEAQDEILNFKDSNTLNRLKSEGFLILVKDSNELKKLEANPLLIVVRISPNGDLRLNTENHGNVLKKTTILDRLTRLFEERGKFGIYQEGTTTVEKTVVVNLTPRLKTKIFNKTMDIVRKSGAAPIYLNVKISGNV